LITVDYELKLGREFLMNCKSETIYVDKNVKSFHLNEKCKI